MSSHTQLLIRVRWLFIATILIVYLVGRVALGFDLLIAPLLIVLTIASSSNFQLNRLVQYFGEERALGVTVLLDVVLLTSILYFYGGQTNPFSTSYLAYIAVAAFLLNEIWTWSVVGLSVTCFGALFLSDVEGGSHHTHATHAFDLHLQGMIASLVVTSFLIAFFSGRLKRAILKREGDLLMQRAQEQRLVSLTTLAAGAAHELATPLATIAVIARDLELSSSKDMAEDCRELSSNVERAQEILSKMMGQAGEIQGELPKCVSIHELVERLKKALNHTPRLDIDVRCLGSEITAPISALVFVLSGLVRNALESSTEQVALLFERSDGFFQFRVTDRGTGIPEEIVSRLGEPFLTTKEVGKGMGLGIYLARLFAQQLGGRISFKGSLPSGTEVLLELPDD